METIGDLVKESIDFAEREIYDLAFVYACDALDRTARKEFTQENLPEPPFQMFIKHHWTLISFIGMRHNVSLPLELPFRLRRAIPTVTSFNMTGEMVIFAARQSLINRRLPPEMLLDRVFVTEIRDDKLLFPRGLIFGLLSSVVLHPLNKNEKIPDNYWLNLAEFKMFISELWGRDDLGKRIIKLYREQGLFPN